MRYGPSLPIFGELADPGLLADLAVQAEEAGWDALFLWDHVQYKGPVSIVTDPWIAMAAMLHATERILTGPMVTPLARRRPQVMARQIVALDNLSDGRFIMGAGLGLDRSGRELSAFGEELHDRTRAAMLDESLELLQKYMSGERFTHKGEHYVADDVQFLPRPVNGTVPFWMAARWPNRRPLKRAARYDGVVVIDLDSPDQLAEIVGRLAEYGVKPGFDIVKQGLPGDDPSAWIAAGATFWQPTFDPFTVTPSLVRSIIAEGPPS